MIGLMCVMVVLLMFFCFIFFFFLIFCMVSMVIVLWEFTAISGNDCGIQGQNYVAWLQEFDIRYIVF